MQLNLADLFEGAVDRLGDRPAFICGEHRRSYSQLDQRANRLAHHLQRSGVQPGQHVGMQLYNGAPYMEALLAVLKIRAVPVNVNYRYVADELAYLYTSADLVALIYDAEFADRISPVLARTTRLRHLVSVDGPPLGSAGMTSIEYEAALSAQPAERGFPPRSSDDLYIIYTGGTTGMPSGVMWRHEDLFMAGHAGGNPGGQPMATPAELMARIEEADGSWIMMPAAPLMHGAAQLAVFITFWNGGTAVFTPTFDAHEVLRAVQREKVMNINIVGDAMAVPLCEALETGDYDPASLIVVSSTGAILSGTNRARLEELLPNRLVLDNFGSTETGFTASAVPGTSPETGMRYLAANASLSVLGPDLKPVRPGSGEIGQLARSGHVPLGYYNDPEKSAATFVEVDGLRCTLAGDMARVDADGAIELLGRGSVCINTGGEKVYPEEVEAVLKGHPEVRDAVVVGVSDPRFGERVAAVVSVAAASATEGELDGYARSRLAGYKVPRQYAVVDEVLRSPSGKADYRWARQTAESAAGE